MGLIYNELLKMVRKKRILVVLLILAILIPIFTYAQYRTVQTNIQNLGTSDWKTLIQQQIVDNQNRLTSSRIPEEWRKLIKISIQQQQYYLDHDINPTSPGAPTFIRKFIDQAISLFLPLLIVVVAADIVSSEHSGGTIKLLLTRPVQRWKVLLAKYVSLILLVSFIVTVTALLSYLISGLVFGYTGWNMPVLTGFDTQNDELITQGVHLVPQWKYILMSYGLAWFACTAVATLSLMVSVLLRSTAASMGTMLAAIIAGNLLTQLSPSWTTIKYFVFTNLSLTNYLSGTPMMIEGMSLPFSLIILCVWSIISLLIAFTVFTKKDILA
nr:ABC transporter permease [Marininema halotolerans]